MEFCNGSAWTPLSGSGGPVLPSATVQAFATSSCPNGWLRADGSAVPRATYAALFGAIATMYGAGDGSSTFNVPDYRGYFLRGVNSGSGNDADAASRANRGDGTAGDNVGTVQADQIVSHGHGLNDPGHSHSISDPGHSHSINDPGHSHGGRVGSGSGITYGHTFSGADVDGNWYASISSSTTGISVNGSGTGISINGSGTGISIKSSGGTETRPKNKYVLYCIKE